MSLPHFDNDLFISYAHLDNETLSTEQEGWVSLLHERLSLLIAQLLGDTGIKVWRDKKLQGNDEFGQEIIAQLHGSAILISVISPRYVNSEWCLRELDTFAAQARDSLQIGSKKRVFKVLKTPVSRDRHPALLQGMLGYEFYEVLDPATGRAREFMPDPGKDIRYYERLTDLAWDIKALLEQLPHEHQPAPASHATATSDTSSGLHVYLATTTSDLTDERDMIKRELERRGHTVLPDQDILPLHGQKLRDTVSGYLQSCQLSVHLIGHYYGVVPELEERSVVHLQHELAAARDNDQHFSRIVWMPPALEPKEEKQRQFIAELQNSVIAGHGSELLQTKIEDLKTILQDKIAQKLQPPPAVSVADHAPKRVYIMCDQVDDEHIVPLTSHLLDQNIEPIQPLRDDDQTEVKQFHKDQLSVCDGVLLYCGAAKHTWLMMSLNELRKLPAYRGSNPLPAKAIYIGGEATPQKEGFRTLEAMVIKNYGEFSPAAIAPFIQQVQAMQGAQPQ